MNTTVVDPEVQEFLTAVRAQLADLDPDEQREILDGLEADLTDLVAERGRGALGDPVAYASELRAAAGLEAEMTGRTARRRHLGDSVAGLMNAAGGRTDALLDRLPGDVKELLAWLRPLWWIGRAWVAVEVVDLVFGRGRYAGDLGVLPHMRGFGGVVLAAAVLGSIQLGRRRFWPGASDSAGARVVLLLLNCTALVMAPLVLLQLGGGGGDHPYTRGYAVGYQQGQADARASYGPKAGLYLNGKWVSNIYPYDANGRPLVGVQLFNQVGQPINVITQPDCVYGADGQPLDTSRVYYPWSNGAAQARNVYPVPSRVQSSRQADPGAFAQDVKPTIGQFPLVSVPRVSLPGIRPSKVTRDEPSFTPGVPVQPKAIGC